jgi:hypothetical protein
LGQLKELEELRVQLSLPGAEAAVEASGTDEGSGAGDGAEATGDSASEDDELEAADSEPRAQGLVARGAVDDAD